MIAKFKAFQSRINSDCEQLMSEVGKYISQVEFESSLSKSQQSPNPLTVNFFQSQMNLFVAPCRKMIEKLEQSFKIEYEKQLAKQVNIQQQNPEVRKKKQKKKPKKGNVEDDDHFLESLIQENKQQE